MNAMYVSFGKLWEVGFYAKLEKCEFHQSQWKSWFTSSLEMAFAWILARFKPNVVDCATLASVRDV